MLHKLHAPFLKLYVEQFYKEMQKICKETLTSMFRHYEATLAWTRQELSVVIKKFVNSILLRNKSKKMKKLTTHSNNDDESDVKLSQSTNQLLETSLLTTSSSSELLPNRDSIAYASDDEAVEEEEEEGDEDAVLRRLADDGKASTSPDRETSPGDSGNSLGNSEEDILVRGDKERLDELHEQLHFRFPNASSTSTTTTTTAKHSKKCCLDPSASDESTLQLLQYILHLHTKVTFAIASSLSSFSSFSLKL